MRNHPHRFRVKAQELTAAVDGTASFEWKLGGVISGRIALVDAEQLTGVMEVKDTQTVTATARVPLGTSVQVGDQLVVSSPTHPGFVGPWQVHSVRTNLDHMRLGLNRWG